MLMRDIVLAIVFVGLAIGIWAATAINMAEQYDVNTTDLGAWNSSFNRIEEISNKTHQMNTSLRTQEISVGSAAYAMMTGAWSVFLIVMNSIPLVGDIGMAMASVLGVPSWITQAILTLISATIIFAIVAAVFWRRMV